MATQLVKINPQNDTTVHTLLSEIGNIKFKAEQAVVASNEDASAATNDLSMMAVMGRDLEDKRTEYVQPLNTLVREMNTFFKTLSGPLDEANKTLRAKVEAYLGEQRRLQQAAEDLNRRAVELAREQAAANSGVFTVDVNPVPVPAAIKTARGGLGSAGLTDNWVYEVTDMDAVPRAYLMPDEAILKATAKAYHDKKLIPGIHFYNDPHLTVRPK